MPVSYKEALLLGRDSLKSAGIENPFFEARVLLSFLLGVSVENIIIKERDLLSDAEFLQFQNLIIRRSNKEPVAHILGKREFYSLDFVVDKNVLIPRPDSEVLIDWILSYYSNDQSIRMLELGVGSGCLVLTLLNHMKNAKAVAVDISSAAIDVAKINYRNLNLSNEIRWINSNWNDLSFRDEEGFDLIISNPPYIRKDDIRLLEKDVKNYEPHSALEGGIDGLDAYRELGPIIKNNIKKSGIAVFEIGKDQDMDVKNIMQKSRLKNTCQIKDLAGIIRGMVFANSP